MAAVEDEFGELYADVDQVKIELEMDGSSNSEPDEVMESNAAAAVKEEEHELSESGSESESESEDDLHIVLNDEDLRVKRLKNDQQEDEYEDVLVIATDQSREEGVEQSSGPGPGTPAERGIKTNCYSQHSQYKYIRSHGTAFPFNAKINGFVSAASFHSSARSDWDASGCNQQQASPVFPVTGQTGRDFSLPRHRTILDVNIDAFEQKPWKHPGTDITDFFNFGLDEESWKHYCNSLEQYRHQTTMGAKTNQVYGAGCGHQTVSPETMGEESAQFGEEGVVSPYLNDAVRGERRFYIPQGRAIQVDGGLGERRPSMDIRRPQNRDSDVVIQVPVLDNMDCSFTSSKQASDHSDNSKLNVSENGCSDGIDVTQDALSSESMDERGRQVLEAYVKDDAWTWSPKRCSRPKDVPDGLFIDPVDQVNEKITDEDQSHFHKAKERVPKESSKAMNNSKEEIQKSSLRLASCTLEEESSDGDRIQYASTSLYSEGDVEVSRVREDPSKGRFHKFPRKSSHSLSGLHVYNSERCQSKDCGINDHKTAHGDIRGDSGDQSHMGGKRESYNRLRLQSVVETTKHVGDDDATLRFSRRERHKEDHLAKSSRKKRERQYENDNYNEDDLRYYTETEISFGYRRERFTGKPTRDAYNEYSHGKGDTNFRNEMDLCLRRYWDDREYFLEKTFTLRESESRERKHLLSERRHPNWRINGPTRDSLTPERSTIHSEKQRHCWKRRKINDEEFFRREAEYDDFVLEQTYKERYIEENCARPVPYFDREKEYLDGSYNKRVSYTSPDRRDRYYGSSCMDTLTDLSRTAVHDDEYWTCPDYESLSPRGDFHITHRRRWGDATSLRSAIYDSERPDGRGWGSWRKPHHEKLEQKGRSDYVRSDSYDDDSVIYSNDYLLSEERGCNRQSRALYCPGDRINSRRHIQGRMYAKEASFSYKQDLCHEANHNKKYGSSHCGNVFDEDWLVQDRDRKIREGARDSVDNIHISSSFDLFDEDEDEQMRHRRSVDLRSVEWEGKAFGRCFVAGDARSNGRKRNIVAIVNEHKLSVHSKGLYSRNISPPGISKVETDCVCEIISKTEEVGVAFDKNLSSQLCKDTGLEEGELLVEGRKKNVISLETNHQLEKTTQRAVTSDKNVAVYDNSHILETLAKMERRRERFKEPIAPKEAEKNQKQEPEIVVDATEPNQQRPTRKRRWGGS